MHKIIDFKYLLGIIFFFFLVVFSFAQNDTIIIRGGKSYHACICRNIKALKCHDSIEAICFPSAGLKDFPKQILKYKKLKLIDFSSYTYKEAWSYINEKEKKKYNSEKKNEDSSLIYFRRNEIYKIPNGLFDLKNLEWLDIGESIYNYKEMERLLKKLGNDKVH